MEMSNISWACASCGFADSPLLEAIASQSRAKLAHFHTQDLSNLAWSFACLAVEHPPLLAAIAAAALRSLAAYDTQALTSIAWALDVLREEPLLEAYLEAAFERFGEAASATPRTSGMSWVELGGQALARPALPGAGPLAERFGTEVGKPALELLGALASPGESGDPVEGHGAAVRALASYAPRHMLPHLGLPFTRRALASLGVAMQPSSSTCHFPSATIREECWLVGIW